MLLESVQHFHIVSFISSSCVPPKPLESTRGQRTAGVSVISCSIRRTRTPWTPSTFCPSSSGLSNAPSETLLSSSNAPLTAPSLFLQGQTQHVLLHGHQRQEGRHGAGDRSAEVSEARQTSAVLRLTRVYMNLNVSLQDQR